MLLGFELSDNDLTAIARLRGAKLLDLIIPSSCISVIYPFLIDDEGYFDEEKLYLDVAPDIVRQKVSENISKPLNRTWSPILYEDLPKGITCYHQTPESTYLNELLAEQSW